MGALGNFLSTSILIYKMGIRGHSLKHMKCLQWNHAKWDR